MSEVIVDLDALGSDDDVDPEIEASSIVDAPKKSRSRSRRRPPSNLAEPVISVPVILRNISFGKGIANVTATLGFELGAPEDMSAYMGQQAFAVVFRKDYLGEGLTVTAEASKNDPDLNVRKTFKLQIPRWANGIDQLEKYIAPLLTDDAAESMIGLFGLSTAWRLNVGVEIGGTLSLHAQQESLGLTERATSDADTATYEPIADGG